MVKQCGLLNKIGAAKFKAECLHVPTELSKLVRLKMASGQIARVSVEIIRKR